MSLSPDKPYDPAALRNAPPKRRKGAARLSCAECRRLKLRCDRSIPCGSCVKRGCAAICPDLSLTTGQGNRFVLASTQELHEKISQLATRIRDLEDALRASHAQLSPDPHHLLGEELLRIKAPLQREPPAQRNSNNTNNTREEEQNPDVVDAFGSLSVSLSGRAKYYGSTAGSWYFLKNEDPDEEEVSGHWFELQSILPPAILSRASSFPISTNDIHLGESDESGLGNLLWHLPNEQRASQLRTIYFGYAAWMYNPISPEDFNREVYSYFYDNIQPSSEDSLQSHRLSLMFMVLAIGSLMDMSQPAYNIDAEKYHQLARAALFQDSLFNDPTVQAVQALFLMAFYLFLVDRHGTSSGVRWAIMGVAVKLAQSIGLHRDSGRWKMDDAETQRRRELFWELYTYDSWQCMTFGRPPSFALAHVDCKMPFPNDPTDEQCFHVWKHRWSSECMNLLHDQAFGARMPTYATILQLDRKMRAFPVPAILQVAGFGSSTDPRPGGYPETVMLVLQRHIVLAIREMNLLYLHRSFFARAINDHPKDPLGSPYGTSVIAAYRSAGSLVALMRNLHAQLKEPAERMWFLWTHMFSCAIVLGSIVTRCPSMSLAPSALVQLDSACELFQKAAGGFRADKVLDVMLRLQEKAHYSLNDFRQGSISPLQRNPHNVESPTSPDYDDELALFGGKTRYKKEPSSPPLQFLERSPISQNPVVPFPPFNSEQVDRNVIEYLGSFNRSELSQLPQRGPTALFSDTLSPSAYGISGYSTPDPPLTYNQQHRPDGLMSSQINNPSQEALNPLQHSSMSSTAIDSRAFPPYFPVYDYTAAAPSSGTPFVPAQVNGRRNSGSPEATMDVTWQDFVAHAMQI
ncbi:hypothetical protein BDN72DRAFT_787970 [Pluteus cervinus]|uniref:Uncharacterized protein n=1 Tax=Pluteus cervinus TaxID=181527 RepID=A0ACD3BB75_9AGAR|nr:hypothetical protein BDN72DRAFT_787970 [Pluteus cervinus]